MTRPENDMQAALDALNRELDSLLYTISHDVRAPLRSLDGFSTALEEDYADSLDDLGRDYLSRIRRAANLADRFMQGLLGISRRTRGELQLQPVDLSRELVTINHELRQTYAPREVRVDIEPDLVVTADLRLARVLLEALMDNAWKFTAGKAEPHISLSSEDTAQGKAACIRDNGVGFDMERAETRLFGMFQHLHDDHEQQGLGTGLATARRIVGRHGGHIWAQAAPGEGAAFCFTLPDGPVRPADEETASHE